MQTKAMPQLLRLETATLHVTEAR